ncbi:MAG: hypothetical protein HDT38_03150 [Clostridiales bacterium]|nr:hypothetical protein [Clostridiales bacterium]
MKNHELLDMIGEASEDYVLEAGGDIARPRFRWQTLAACAACAALIVAAYPAWQVLSRKSAPDSVAGLEDAPEASRDPAGALVQRPGLHEYTLVEGGVTIKTTQGDAEVAAGGAAPPALMPEANLPGGAYDGGGDAGNIDSANSDASVQEEAFAQYEQLLRGMGVYGQSEPVYPDWFGGSWLDGEHLTVAVVDGFRTPGLEAQIREWCGGTAEILLPGVKYSLAYLEGLKDEVGALLDQYGRLSSVIDANEMTNRVELDIFAVPGDELLAALAELDPEGDAIYIQVFTDVRIVPTDGAAKDPAPDAPAVESVPGGARAEPSIGAEPTPAPAEDSEWTMPADEPGEIEDLPQAKYDIIEGE